jgi:hypothetical protein
MIADPLSYLLRSPEDAILAEDRTALIREMERRTIRPGNGVRTRQLDTCVLVSYEGAGGTSFPHSWKPRADFTSSGKPGVRFSRGLVNGIEPVVGELKISDDTSEPLEIPDYNDAGDCMLYVELKLNSFWQIEKAEMKAHAKPEWAAWTARKLVAIAQEDGRIVPRARFDFGFSSSERKPSGMFRQWWWAMS